MLNLLKFLLFFPFLIFYSEISLSYAYYNNYGHQSLAQNPSNYASPADLCHSLELAALYGGSSSSKKSSKSQIRSLEKKIENLEEGISEKQGEVSDASRDLKQSLKQTAGVFTNAAGDSEKAEDVVKDITNYIRYKKDGWDCNDSFSGMDFIFNYPYAFNFLKENLLPQAQAAKPPVNSADKGKSERLFTRDTKKVNESPLAIANPNSIPSPERAGTEAAKKAAEAAAKKAAAAEAAVANSKTARDALAEQAKQDFCKYILGEWKHGKCDPSQKDRGGDCPEGRIHNARTGGCIRIPNDIPAYLAKKKREEERIRDVVRAVGKGLKKTGEAIANGLDTAGYAVTDAVTGVVGAVKDVVNGETGSSEGDNGGDLDQSPKGACEARGEEWGWFGLAEGCRKKGTESETSESATTTVIEEESTQSTTPAQEEEEVVKPDCTNKSNWKKNEYFKRNGEVEDGFCEEYAENVDGCLESLSDIKRHLEAINKKRKYITKHDKEIDNLHLSEDDETETEAGAPCIDCLKKLRALDRPTTGQTIGNIASIVSGLGLGYLGVREARKARRETNELRAWQGFEAESNHGYTLAGLGLAYPFVSQGLYGLTKPRASSCGSTVNSYRNYNW